MLLKNGRNGFTCYHIFDRLELDNNVDYTICDAIIDTVKFDGVLTYSNSGNTHYINDPLFREVAKRYANNPSISKDLLFKAVRNILEYERIITDNISLSTSDIIAKLDSRLQYSPNYYTREVLKNIIDSIKTNNSSVKSEIDSNIEILFDSIITSDITKYLDYIVNKSKASQFTGKDYNAIKNIYD